MDSLGGILIKGFLGSSMVLARLSLFANVLIEDITPEPPAPVVMGGGSTFVPRKEESNQTRTIRITISFKNKTHVSTHTIHSGVLKIAINTIDKISYVKDKVSSIIVNLRPMEQHKLQASDIHIKKMEKTE